jgi:hypothetical protein
MQSELAAQLMATLEQWHPPLEGDDVNPVLAFARQWLQKAQDCELVSMGTRRQEEWGRGIVTVVKQGDESVAMVMWSQPTRRSERRGCILELWRTIAKSDHGQKSLLFFLKKARQKGYTQAMVEGSQCTQTLVPFYQSCGFGRVGDGSSWSMQTALLEVVEEEEQQRQDPEEEQEEEEEEQQEEQQEEAQQPQQQQQQHQENEQPQQQQGKEEQEGEEEDQEGASCLKKTMTLLTDLQTDDQKAKAEFKKANAVLTLDNVQYEQGWPFIALSNVRDLYKSGVTYVQIVHWRREMSSGDSVQVMTEEDVKEWRTRTPLPHLHKQGTSVPVSHLGYATETNLAPWQLQLGNDNDLQKVLACVSELVWGWANLASKRKHSLFECGAQTNDLRHLVMCKEHGNGLRVCIPVDPEADHDRAALCESPDVVETFKVHKLTRGQQLPLEKLNVSCSAHAPGGVITILGTNMKMDPSWVPLSYPAIQSHWLERHCGDCIPRSIENPAFLAQQVISWREGAVQTPPTQDLLDSINAAFPEDPPVFSLGGPDFEQAYAMASEHIRSTVARSGSGGSPQGEQEEPHWAMRHWKQLDVSCSVPNPPMDCRLWLVQHVDQIIQHSQHPPREQGVPTTLAQKTTHVLSCLSEAHGWDMLQAASKPTHGIRQLVSQLVDGHPTMQSPLAGAKNTATAGGNAESQLPQAEKATLHFNKADERWYMVRSVQEPVHQLPIPNPANNADSSVTLPCPIHLHGLLMACQFQIGCWPHTLRHAKCQVVRACRYCPPDGYCQDAAFLANYGWYDGVRTFEPSSKQLKPQNRHKLLGAIRDHRAGSHFPPVISGQDRARLAFMRQVDADQVETVCACASCVVCMLPLSEAPMQVMLNSHHSHVHFLDEKALMDKCERYKVSIVVLNWEDMVLAPSCHDDQAHQHHIVYSHKQNPFLHQQVAADGQKECQLNTTCSVPEIFCELLRQRADGGKQPVLLVHTLHGNHYNALLHTPGLKKHQPLTVGHEQHELQKLGEVEAAPCQSAFCPGLPEALAPASAEPSARPLRPCDTSKKMRRNSWVYNTKYRQLTTP